MGLVHRPHFYLAFLMVGFHFMAAQINNTKDGSGVDTSEDQNQMSQSFYGENPGDQCGRAMGLNSRGTVVAIGLPFSDVLAEDAGKVQIYKREGHKWIGLGNGISGKKKGGLFGSSVSLNAEGDIVAVGVPFSNNDGMGSGQVMVYKWNKGDWVPLGGTINGEFGGDSFGSAVSLSENGFRLAIGALYSDVNGEDSGQVNVYEYRSGEWVSLGSDIVGSAVGEQFGATLKFNADGNKLIVGAPFNSDNDTFSGKVRIFEWKDEGRWVQMGNNIVGKERFGALGNSVSMSADGKLIAIGGILGGKDGSGRVNIFKWNGDDWDGLAYGIPSETGSNVYGNIVSLSGDGQYIAIGKLPVTSSKMGKGGEIWVYEISKSGRLTPTGFINGEKWDELFGWDFRLSMDGSTIAIGAPFNNKNGLLTGRLQVVQLK